MRNFTTRFHRFARVTVASLGLLMLLSSVSLAESWSTVRKPTFPPVSVNASMITFGDGSVLYSDGTYINDSTTYAVPAACLDAFGNLCFADGTILYSDGSWTPGNN